MGNDLNTPSSTDPSSSTPHRRRKIWTIGTLTYTTAGLLALFFWLLLGDFSWMLRDRAIGPTTQLVLKKFEASDFIIAIICGTIPALIGLVLGPIISVKSDRFRSRWGRRIPFLFVPAPFIFLSMAGLAFSHDLGQYLNTTLGAHSPGPTMCVILVFGFFWCLFDITTVISNAVFGGLVNDVVPHEILGRFFGLFRIVSLIAGIVFNYWLLGKVEEHYVVMFIGLGIIYTAGIMLMCLNVKEGDYPAPTEHEKNASRWSIISEFFKESFGMPYYLFYYFFVIVSGLCFMPINFFQLLYAKSIGFNLDAFGKITAYSYIASIVLAYPLGALVDRFHVLRVSLVTMFLYFLTTLFASFMIKDSYTFGAAIIAHTIMSGTYFTTSAALGQMLLPKNKFAQYSAAGGMIGAIVNMISTPILGIVLDATGHQYRYTFVASCILCGITIISGLILYIKFIKLGGPKNYVAPE